MKTEQPARVELQLSDSFHRIKRTLLLFCGALVVLGCTSPGAGDGQATLITTLAPSLTPSLVVLRALLLVAAAYYFWGFLHEFRAAHRQNADLLDADSLPQYEEQVRSFASQLSGHLASLAPVVGSSGATLERALNHVEKATEYLKGDIAGQIRSFLYSLDEGSGHLRNSDDATARQKYLDQQIETAAGHWGRVLVQSNGNVTDGRGEVRQVLSDFSQLQQSTDRLAALAQKAADRIKLNKAIYGDRAISFFGWEFGGGIGAFAAAVFCTLTPYGFLAAKVLESLLARL